MVPVRLIDRKSGETDLLVGHKQILLGSGFRSSKAADDYKTASKLGFERMWTENMLGQVYVYDVVSDKLYQYNRFGDKFTSEKFQKYDPVKDQEKNQLKDLFMNKHDFEEKYK
ncbi:MAG: hypothetical protein SFV17_14670 [Candidatus Obscuribacter sp.]|nr:hypothetical protein [Candidatus Obscuribacter sp.]